MVEHRTYKDIEYFRVTQSLWIRIIPLVVSFGFIVASVIEKDAWCMLPAAIFAAISLFFLMWKMDYIKDGGDSLEFYATAFKRWSLLKSNIREIRAYKGWDISDGFSYCYNFRVVLVESVEIPDYVNSDSHGFDEIVKIDGDGKKAIEFSYIAAFVTVKSK